MGTKIVITTKIVVAKIKKIILKIKKSLIWLVIIGILSVISLWSSCITIFKQSPTTVQNYITNLAPAGGKDIICENFFNDNDLSSIDQFVVYENNYKLRDDVIFADLVCKEALPVNFSAKVEFIPKNNGVINFGLSEYSSLNHNIFRIIIGDGNSTNIVIKDKNNNNLKIKYYSDSQYSEKLSLKDPISSNNVVRLKVTQESILNGQAELTISLDYTPTNDIAGKLVTANMKAVIENVNFLSDSKYLVGIGMYRGNKETDVVELEFLSFQVKEFTM